MTIKRAVLQRVAEMEFGVFGYLTLLDEQDHPVATLRTAEEDWRDNAVGQSCIPAGSYQCRRGTFPRMGETFEITGVPGRSAILIHAGNTEEDVEGCVLLGMRFGAITVKDEDSVTHQLTEKWDVADSHKAMTWFLGLLAGVDAFMLEIRWPEPGAWRTQVLV